ncbi:LysR family transcriptional regulator, nitrogen assimilation regulatory protein [Salinihabitans flavidus]|uniref:LysR family transcriptional regulator, nitrogen assimilation regulatory protein n=1 Tax=Salinihabitans flavidus TaxID=569882 RepID=A0A1H8L6F3_9RHOB|nr:LysR family transcriptional regulator [Salinihabitans flavidus]SEO00734.1 LysR family transcriptional regulator, nitrogen assimilation regulatory protein [Salinihabitans flavidus]
MLNSRQLRYFAAIFEQGSLTKAASYLRVAGSALSHHLSQLEAELGTTLFERKPRGMQATAAGLRLYDHARLILRAMDSAETDLRAAGENISGTVAVGMSFSAVKAIGVEFVRRVMTDFPDVQLVLSESLSGAALPHLMASDIDMALVYNPPEDSSLRAVPVLEERMVCVGSPQIIGDTEAPITFEKLLELPIILLRQGVSARAIMDDVTLLKKIEARARLQMNSVQAIAGALEAQLGCVIGTRLFMQDQLAAGVVNARPIIEPELSRTLYLCHLSSRPPTFATETIRDVLLELVRQSVNNGHWDARLIAS